MFLDTTESLQMREVDANLFNKQLRATDKELSFRLGLKIGLTTPHRTT
jgi:hypothetical protein